MRQPHSTAALRRARPGASGASTAGASPLSQTSIDHLVNPRSVAIFGVTDSRQTWGSTALRQSAALGFSGALYGVSQRSSLQGFDEFRIVQDIADIEDSVDCALIAVGKDRTLAALEACASSGVRSAVVVAAGFGELGAEGRALEAQMLDVARSAGMRILGPNCIGLFRSGGVCTTPFVLPPGAVGMATQSGNVAIALGLRAKGYGFGFSTCVGVGNQLDVGFGELLSWFANDPATSSVAIYLEGIPRGAAAAFADGLSDCHRAQKPVFVLRGGITEAGSSAVGTHTGSLTSDARVWSALLEGGGAVSVSSVEALADSLLATRLPRFGRGVAVMTDGGGDSVMAMDSLALRGLPLAKLSERTRLALIAVLPPLAPRHEGLNPLTLDTPGGLQDNPELLATCAEICADDPAVGALVIAGLFGGYQRHSSEEIAAAQRLASLCNSGMPIAVASAYDGVVDDTLVELRRAGIPVYGCIERLAAAVAPRYERVKVHASDPPREAVRVELRPEVGGGRKLATTEALDRLRRAGLPCPPVRMVRSAKELVLAQEELGFPLCLKLDVQEIVHKSEVGAVKLGLNCAEELEQASAQLWEQFPSSELLVMPMFAPGFELLVGLTWDATFGALVAVGRGGIWTEVEDDFAVVPALSTESELVGALSSLRCFPMISGTRGQPRLDLEALVDLIGSVGKLADEGEPLSLDLNPVILYVHGLAIADFRVLAVDPW